MDTSFAETLMKFSQNITITNFPEKFFEVSYENKRIKITIENFTGCVANVKNQKALYFIHLLN